MFLFIAFIFLVCVILTQVGFVSKVARAQQILWIVNVNKQIAFFFLDQASTYLWKGTMLLRESLLWLAEELKIEKHHTPKTLIYVKDIQQINDLKILFGEVCGDLLFHPDYPKSISSSLVQAYYAKAGKSTKEKVFNDFSPKEHSRVRIVICTIAFGLGAYC